MSSSNKNIFLNYRRDDTAGHAGRLFDRLHYRFPGRVFRDVTVIAIGADFIEEIERRLASCGVMIVLIGKHWLTLKDEHDRPRLHDPEDFVRLEIAKALRSNVAIIPVLVAGARMPSAAELPEDLKPLARRQAIEITEPDFESDVARLIRAVEWIIDPHPHPPPPPPPKPGRRFGTGFLVGIGVAVAAVVGLIIMIAVLASNSSNNSPQPSVNPPRNAGPQPGIDSTTFRPVGRWRVTRAPSGQSEFLYTLDLMGNNRFAAQNEVQSFTGNWQFSQQTQELRLSSDTGPVEWIIQNIRPHENHFDAIHLGVGEINLWPQ